jgi:hypothetical protein
MWRLRFSLRTMLVVTAFVAVLLMWVEWNRRIIRERQALIGLGWNRVAVWTLGEPNHSTDFAGRAEAFLHVSRTVSVADANTEAFPATEVGSVPWILRLLGDRAYGMVKTSDPQLVPRLRKWFPEAVCLLDDEPFSFDERPMIRQ